MEYVLVIHPAEQGGYWAEVPALDGCFIHGETLEEVLADAPAAITSHIEALSEDGQAVPEGSRIFWLLSPSSLDPLRERRAEQVAART